MSKQQTGDPQPRRSSALLYAITLLAVAALVLSLGPAQSSATPVAAQTSPQYWLLKLAPQAREAPQLALSGYDLLNWTQPVIPGWVRVTIARDHDRTLAALRADPAVQVVEPDHRVHVTLTPDDTYWDVQWGPQMVRAPAAWNINTGSPDVVVAVLDTGIDRSHGDLTGQLWINSGEMADNFLDDDGNGYVDDVNGWSFIGDSAWIDDDHGHGTHVSGTIAARGNNGQGIAGMAWGSRVMVVKVLDENGDGYYSGLAAGLRYAVDNGARVANLSLGGSSPSQMLQDAVNYAHARGLLIVASSGNTNRAVQYPGACDNVLAVAASTSDDKRATYSCYGPELDLTAPGSSVFSTCVGGNYCYKSGTSMAAPHVAGLAALVYAQRPAFSPDQVAQLLQNTAQDMGEPGWDQYTGWGRIDAYRALSGLQAQFLHTYLPLIYVTTVTASD
jgi:subtilisin family serine protease